MAQIVKHTGDYTTRVGVYLDLLEMIYEDGNPNFDLQRFRRACGLSAVLHPELLSLETEYSGEPMFLQDC
jgi:hypothetical protein